ncbi:MAG: hypothetical protein KGS61_06480 [Verrucomicrobia bacterium]|nr:hypothetical protein [Verrucomicrobiota bacterium]
MSDWPRPGPPRPASFCHCAAGNLVYVTGMDWQQIVSLTMVGLAAVALLGSWFRPRKVRFGGGGHCGCSSPAQTNPQSSIVFRARKGGRPEVVVRMK